MSELFLMIGKIITDFEKYQEFVFSQMPHFCKSGKGLDCFSKESPCKRRHKKECRVFQQYEKIREFSDKLFFLYWKIKKKEQVNKK